MVTGVETAGLVLATIPLIICALENYENTIGPTKAFIRWKGHLAIARNQLYVHYAAFDQTLQILLSAVVDAEDLTTMIKDTTNTLWTKGYIAEDLELHLGKAHVAVMYEIERIADDLLEIAQHLNIDGAQKATRRDLSSIVQGNPPNTSSRDPLKRHFLRDRVNFTMKRRVLKEKMNDIRQSIESLTTFAGRADKLHSGSSWKHHKIKFLAPLESIRHNACEVHKVLVSRWCVAHTPHRAAILLEDRLNSRRRGMQGMCSTSRNQLSKGDCFALCLNDHVSPRWLPTEVRLVKAPLGAPSAVAVTAANTTALSSKDPSFDPTTLEEVAEICSYLRKRVDGMFGFCLDYNHKLSAYSGQTAGGLPNDTQGLTLAEILPQVPSQLVNGDLYQLAIALTATVLQLDDTPWLDGTWNKSAILFTRSCSRVSGNVDIKYPFLLTEFQTAPTNTRATTGTPSPTTRTQTALLSLAIMLLEVNSGETIETVRTAQDLGNRTSPDIESDFMTAQRWLRKQQSNGQLSFGFLSAIKSCLQAWLNPYANISDEEFCTHIQESVIKPLVVEMQCLRYGV